MNRNTIIEGCAVLGVPAFCERCCTLKTIEFDHVTGKPRACCVVCSCGGQSRIRNRRPSYAGQHSHVHVAQDYETGRWGRELMADYEY